MNNLGIPMQRRQNVFKINQLFLIATRTYKPVYNRSYTLKANNHILNRLTDLAHRHGSSNIKITEADIATDIPEVVDLNPLVVGESFIPNGWETERMMFLLECEHQINGLTVVSYIQGFTEFHDPSYRDSIDENMLFYINSISQITKSYNPVTGQLNINPYNMFNIIRDISGKVTYEVERNNLKTIRPNDILSGLYLDMKYNTEGERITNINNEISPLNVFSSKRTNNNPMEYISSTLNHYREAKINSGTSWSTTALNVVSDSIRFSKEYELTEHPFLMAIKDLTGILVPTEFTLNTLMSLDEHIVSKIKKFNRDILPSQRDLSTILDSDITQDTLQPTMENLKANFLATTIPSLMIECLIYQCDISISNTTNEPVVYITNPMSLIGDIDMITFIEKLQIKIKNIILPKLTEKNQLHVEAFIHANIIGDISISLGLNGIPPTLYRFPTFADSLYSPVITNQLQSEQVVNDFSNMLDATYGEVYEDLSNNNQLY